MLWEQVELNEIAKKRIEKNNNLVNNNVLSNSAIYGIIKQNEYFDKTIANNINNYYVVHKDDFVYNPRISNHAPFGPISRNNFNESGIMSPLYLVFYFSTKSLNNYLEMYFKSSKWYKFMYKNGNSGARADRFVIKDNDFFKMEVKIPNDKNEQNKISQILNVLNNLITLYENKQRLMKTMFKGVSAYLFNFSREKNVLKKALTSIIISETKGSAKENMLQNGSLEYLDTNRLNGGKPKLVSGKKDVSCKDIIILWDGSKAGTIYYGFSGILGSTLKVFKLSKEVNSEYVYFYLKLNQELIFHKYRTPNIPHVSKDFSKRFSLSLPKKELQDLIANTLHSFNLEITLIDSKISKLKEVKKELLQNMFI